jgi:hypothetical protein
MRLGPGKHLKGRTLMNGLVKPEQFDYFHEVRLPFKMLSESLIKEQLIINTEIARFGTRGFLDGMLNGMVISLPPVCNYGSPELQAKVIPEVWLNSDQHGKLHVDAAFRVGTLRKEVYSARYIGSICW